MNVIEMKYKIIGLEEENEELKSQIKGTTHCYDEVEHKQLKKQQQEFIKYLEDEIKHLEHSRYVSFNEFGEHKLMFYKEILSIYKEIIGDVEDDKSN